MADGEAGPASAPGPGSGSDPASSAGAGAGPGPGPDRGASSDVAEVRLYNTKTHTVEPVRTVEPGIVRYYVCGISVSGPPHVGHGRSYVIFDVLRRVLEHAGYEVRHVQNFTDIEEAITKRAKARGITPEAYAQEMTTAYFDAMDRLGVQRAHHFPTVTAYIDRIIGATQRLLDQDCAYEIDDGIAFRTCDQDDFGDLLGGDPNDFVLHEVPEHMWNGRKNPFDFVLWRNTDDLGIVYETPWGEGRPGWHTECAVMATDLLGPVIDIHGGGHDLVFPHHESERAIARCLTGQAFCHHWVHNGLVTMGAEKMSKSLGNIVGLAEAIDEFGAAVVRTCYLLRPYRQAMEWRDKERDQAQRIVEELSAALDAPGGGAVPPEPAGDEGYVPAVTRLRNGLLDALRTDLDLPRAIDTLLELARYHAGDAGAGALMVEGLDLVGLAELEPFRGPVEKLRTGLADGAEGADGR